MIILSLGPESLGLAPYDSRRWLRVGPYQLRDLKPWSAPNLTGRDPKVPGDQI
jgi:hypothetical protein